MLLSVIFPGQGSQHVGMGKIWHQNFKLAKELFEEASDTLKWDLQKLCFEDPQQQLHLTQYTQVALFLVGHVTSRILQSETPLSFQMACGHSVGEYGACLEAEVFSFSQGLHMVQKRGELMSEAIKPNTSGMAALLGSDLNQAQALCEWARQENPSKEGVLECANINAPSQIVLSGHLHLLEWLKNNLEKSSLPGRKKLIPLKTSAAFHSSLMKPAEEKMKDYLKDIPFLNPRLLIVQNVTAQGCLRAPEIKTNLVQQISRPVQWQGSCQYMKQQGIQLALEVGPGATLAGLMKRCAPEIKTLSLNDLEDLKALEKLTQTAEKESAHDL